MPLQLVTGRRLLDVTNTLHDEMCSHFDPARDLVLGLDPTNGTGICAWTNKHSGLSRDGRDSGFVGLVWMFLVI
jgi:hypothetical protein